MSATESNAKAAPPPVAKETEAENPPAASTAVSHKKSGGSGGSRDGLWNWRYHLMNWRSGGDSSAAEVNTESAPTAHVDEPKKEVDVKEAKTQGGDESGAAEGEGGTAAASTAPTSAPAARPMNIWLRRALERQAESAIAEAIRDGKPIPAVSVPAAAVAGKAPEPAKDANTGNDTAAKETSEKTAAAAASVPKVSFADLMRQHREGLLTPTAQPPVKATKVVKKPKAATGAAEAAKEHQAGAPDTATTPTAKNRKAAAAAAVESKKPKDKETGEETAARSVVHQGAVRKRAKASAALNSASANRQQAASAAASAIATPVHTITVKGTTSLEELRERRNRTTVSAYSTPSPITHGADKKDGYNEDALEAVSQLLQRYCYGDQSSSTTLKTAEGSSAVSNASGASAAAATTANTAASNDLAFFSQLMELYEKGSLTVESLELLQNLFQRARVLRRPAPTAADSAEKVSEGNDSEKAASGTAAGAVAESKADTEAYHKALRRREYVQQVIMVVTNRMKQLKLNEQQRQQKQEEAAASAAMAQAVSDAGWAPQPFLGHALPSKESRTAPLKPLPSTAATATAAAAAELHKTQQQQPTPLPNTVSYDEQMRRLAECRSVADGASRNNVGDEAASAAAFVSAMAADGYPNPYAHLTVFSQHQPVAPPVWWPAPAASKFSPEPAGARCGRDGQGVPHSSSGTLNPAAQFMSSPFPGAFPIPLPPSPAGPGGNGESVDEKEHRETLELFRMICNQLNQPVQPLNHGTSPSTVDVSPAERSILRHVQEDFKKQQQRTRSTTGNTPSPQTPPTASTPPTRSLDAPEAPPDMPHRTLFTPQGKPQEKGDSPSTRSAAPAPATAGGGMHSQLSPVAQTSTTDKALRIEAKPFVPGDSTASAASAVAAQSKPNAIACTNSAAPFMVDGVGPAHTTAAQRTVFRYEAKPFTPSVSGNKPFSTAAVPARMNPRAPAFVPGQQHQRYQSPPSSWPNSAAGTPSEAVDPATDPWVSYEMFARWRDMMETYYQSVFTGQAATGALPPHTTPPRHM
ncbi:hypothetical protein ABL78_6931 [Leptomonas seymouri]|uniref:Uncharacterized protein n=1 Tax=Leptomonas seymouri TaxID=5684 RepID=A0A0N1PAC9_LEPSE|nr:hypothetical protein ABL78_6931 [Leptomonas seymouri]|eukprot:KPI84022.1 hypothetical protein ABL78_6931 [Leptomonas seymouri]